MTVSVKSETGELEPPSRHKNRIPNSRAHKLKRNNTHSLSFNIPILSNYIYNPLGNGILHIALQILPSPAPDLMPSTYLRQQFSYKPNQLEDDGTSHYQDTLFILTLPEDPDDRKLVLSRYFPYSIHQL